MGTGRAMDPFFLIVLVLVFHPWGQVDFVERPMGTGRFFHLRGQVGWSLQKAHSATNGRFTSHRTYDPSIRRLVDSVYVFTGTGQFCVPSIGAGQFVTPLHAPVRMRIARLVAKGLHGTVRFGAQFVGQRGSTKHFETERRHC